MSCIRPCYLSGEYMNSYGCSCFIVSELLDLSTMAKGTMTGGSCDQEERAFEFLHMVEPGLARSTNAKVGSKKILWHGFVFLLAALTFILLFLHAYTGFLGDYHQTSGNEGKSVKGDPGLQGLPGSPGQKSSPGQQGLPGAPGQKGSSGQQGLPGAPGPKGPSGQQGLPGDPGQKGSPGQQGLSGAPGQKGSSGQQGLPGSQGPKGPSGQQGLPGSPGQKGSSGQKGLPGAPGQKGSSGPSGPSGRPGEPGPRGERGPRGRDGNGCLFGKKAPVIEVGMDSINGGNIPACGVRAEVRASGTPGPRIQRGKFNNAIYLPNVNNGDGNCIDLGNHRGFCPYSLSLCPKGLTVSIWYKIDPNMDWWLGALVSGRDWHFRIFRHNKTGYEPYVVFQKNDTYRRFLWGQSHLPLNEWHQVAFAFHDFDDAKLFIDGQLNRQTTVGIRGKDTLKNLTVGCEWPGNAVRGSFDQLQIWDYAKSDEEIAHVYNFGE